MKSSVRITCSGAIRKEGLDVVDQKMSLLSKVLDKRNKLIRSLMNNEKRTLKLTEDKFDIDREHNSEKVITVPQESEAVGIYMETNMKCGESIVGKKLKKVTFPVIHKHKIDKMISALSTKNSLSMHNKKLENCLAHLHTSIKPPCNSPSLILKAINDSLLRRNWKNLTKLLLMLIHLPSVKYKPIIRHICEILDKYHPVIQHNGLQSQFHTITLANRSMKTGNTTLL